MEESTVIRRVVNIDTGREIAPDISLSIEVTIVAPAPDAGPPPRAYVLAIPGGTYNRQYWDMLPPGRVGYSQAEYSAKRGVVFIACDYLGGGKESRPDEGDFIGLEAQADAAHAVFKYISNNVRRGTLIESFPPISEPIFIGIGQSLGGFITLIQQAKYEDYTSIGVFGASPLLGAPVREEYPIYWKDLSRAEQRLWMLESICRIAGVESLPHYHCSPRQYGAGWQMVDTPQDLLRYDVEQCLTLLPRFCVVDAMMPDYLKRYADRIRSPIFLAFGDHDTATHSAHGEPAGYPASLDITLVVIPKMAHMHNFAETRARLWDRFLDWLPN